MTWIKLQDNCPRHPKVEALSDRAFRVWIGSLCYASEFLTNGVLPEVFWKKIPKSIRAELSSCGLWDWSEPNFLIHDYLHHQTRKEDVEHEKARNRAKAAAYRGRKRGDVTGNATGDSSPPRYQEVPNPENREQRTDTENREQNAPKERRGPAPLIGRRNLHAEFEHPRFDVPTWWHLEKVKGVAGGESRMLKFYSWLAERVERTNEDTEPRKKWLETCWAEWLDATRVTASSVPSVEDTKRRQAELETRGDPRFFGKSLKEIEAILKQDRAGAVA